MKIEAFKDATFIYLDDKSRRIEGQIIMLENLGGHPSTIPAYSSAIAEVYQTVKATETRAMEHGMEKTIRISRMIEVG